MRSTRGSELATLQEAQVAKFERICRKLRLGPNDHLLEIGTGWGGLALHAAQRYGCRVTTTTISREQHDHAREAIARAGTAAGAIMAVPAHDERDFEFATKFGLDIIEVISHPDAKKDKDGKLSEAYPGDGTMVNSGDYTGMDSAAGKKKITSSQEIFKVCIRESFHLKSR